MQEGKAKVRAGHGPALAPFLLQKKKIIIIKFISHWPELCHIITPRNEGAWKKSIFLGGHIDLPPPDKLNVLQTRVKGTGQTRAPLDQRVCQGERGGASSRGVARPKAQGGSS